METTKKANEEDFDISIRPAYNKYGPRFRIYDDGFLVRLAREHHALLPAGVSVVFQQWNAGGNSVLPCERQPHWPQSYGPAIWVRSVDLEEIFRLTQVGPLSAADSARVWRLPPWQDGPSLSVGDIVAINSGDGFVDFHRRESNGWTVLGVLNSY